MKATYLNYPGTKTPAYWVFEFNSEADAIYAHQIFSMIVRKGVRVIIKEKAYAMLNVILPDDNPNPFTTDVLRPGAAVGAAELGAVLCYGYGKGHCKWSIENGLIECYEDGTNYIHPLTKNLWPTPSNSRFTIDSFPPFTDPQ